MFKNIDSLVRHPEFKSQLFSFAEDVISGKFLNLSTFWFPLLQNGNPNSNYFMGGWED